MDEGMRIWREAWKTAFLGHAAYADDQAAARIITDAMAADKAEIARLREALRQYGVHATDCPRWHLSGPNCTCGFTRAALEKTDV